MALTKVTKELIGDRDLTISGGAIDNSIIGGSTAAAGSFTTLQGTTITATTAFVPDASDGAALGTTSLEFSDLYLADGAVVYLGNDQDVSLTHVADTGILLNSTRQLQFGDSGTYIHQSADGVLDLVSDTEIEINATTVDINGAVQIDATVTVGVNDTGYDVKFFGATSGKYMEWDESADQLDVTGSLDVTGDASVTGTLQLKNGSTSAGKIEFYEDSDNGTNKVTLIGPASTSDITLTLPNSDGDADQALVTDGSGNLSFASVAGGLTLDTSVKSSNFTAVAGNQYLCNTSGGAFTVTLPSSPSAGDTIGIIDYNGNFDTNNLTLAQASSKKILRVDANATIDTKNWSTNWKFIDDTVGWLPIDGS